MCHGEEVNEGGVHAEVMSLEARVWRLESSHSSWRVGYDVHMCVDTAKRVTATKASKTRHRQVVVRKST